MAEIELDLRSVPEYAETNLWVCDIEELKEDDEDGDGVPDDCDFLFYGDIIPDGTVEMKKSATEGGKAIFQEVMYDIQEFIPDTTFDGTLTFSIKFGARTVERKDNPEGWEVFFKDLRGKSNEFAGIVNTSWWGDRNVKLKRYGALTPDEKKMYPDLVAKYFRTI